MIAVRIQGRLGNQLFQYAFALSASKRLNTRFYVDQYIDHFTVNKYFKGIDNNYFAFILKVFNLKGYKNFFTFYLRRAYFKDLQVVSQFAVRECDFEAKISEITLQNNTLYQGFFQSELFFIDFEKLIRRKLVLKKGYVDLFNIKYGILYQSHKIIAVHIRRTDYLNLGHLDLGGDDLSLPVEYYQKAISKFYDQDIHFVFISDDKAFVNRNFEDIKNKTVTSDTEIMDFQHLLNADGCIISNSTFSWWGAWLNNKKIKVIYGPKYFMGWRIKKETPPDIYPKDWVQIDF